MHILMILSNSFTNDPRVYNEAKTLISAGHKVTVLAWDRSGRHRETEKKEGIFVIRVFNEKIMDFIPYDIFKLRFWWKKGYKKALSFYNEKGFDILYCHNFDTLPIGIKLKRKLDLSLVYDAHEIWGYMVEKDVPWWRYYLWKEKMLLRFVDHMIVTNPARKDFYKHKCRCEITVIDNYKHVFSEKYIEPPNHQKKKLIIIYIGVFIQKRFLLELIDVVKELKDVRLKIGGRGKLYEGIKNETKKINNIDFLGIVDSKQVIPMTLKSDVVFCMIAPNDKNDITASTNKQFEAMVAGRPIITSKGTYSGDVTKKENVGVEIPFSKENLKEELIKLRDSPKLREELGKNALRKAIEKYNWEKQEEKLIEIYENY